MDIRTDSNFQLDKNMYSHPLTDCFVLSEHFSVAKYKTLLKIKTQLTYAPAVDATAQPQGN